VDHGLTLELGVYVTKILPGSVAAKEGVIAVGDRIVNVSDASAKKNDSLNVAFCGTSRVTGRVARFVPVKNSPKGEKYTNWHKNTEMAAKYTKWP
jgi:C-terminal processing protease CtpA/Prc